MITQLHLQIAAYLVEVKALKSLLMNRPGMLSQYFDFALDLVDRVFLLPEIFEADCEVGFLEKAKNSLQAVCGPGQQFLEAQAGDFLGKLLLKMMSLNG